MNIVSIHENLDRGNVIDVVAMLLLIEVLMQLSPKPYLDKAFDLHCSPNTQVVPMIRIFTLPTVRYRNREIAIVNAGIRRPLAREIVYGDIQIVLVR